MEIFFKSVFVDAVQRLCAVGLKVYVDRFRPTAGLISFRKSNPLAHKTGTAVKEFSSFGDGKKSFTVRHCISGENCNGFMLALFAV